MKDPHRTPREDAWRHAIAGAFLAFVVVGVPAMLIGFALDGLPPKDAQWADYGEFSQKAILSAVITSIVVGFYQLDPESPIWWPLNLALKRVRRMPNRP